MGTDLFLVDRRTYITKLIVVFRNFANAPKNTSHLYHSDTDLNYTPLNLRDPLHNKKGTSE
jgi:hypothetical protein